MRDVYYIPLHPWTAGHKMLEFISVPQIMGNLREAQTHWGAPRKTVSSFFHPPGSAPSFHHPKRRTTEGRGSSERKFKSLSKQEDSFDHATLTTLATPQYTGRTMKLSTKMLFSAWKVVKELPPWYGQNEMRTKHAVSRAKERNLPWFLFCV